MVDSVPLVEPALLAAARNGDEAAFDALVGPLITVGLSSAGHLAIFAAAQTDVLFDASGFVM